MNSKKLFIHIPKNAGLTVRRSLSDYIITCNKNTLIDEEYKNNLIETMNKANEHYGFEHARWRDIKKSLTNKYQAFAIIRNPWTKVVSRYMYGLRAIENGRAPENYIPKKFEEFLEQRFEYQNKEYYWHRATKGWYPQKDHVVDDNNNIKCDILRFEYFNDDIKSYLNLPEDFKIKSSNNYHRGNKDPKWAKWDIDYKTLYTNSTIQIVADWYKNDIDLFDFDYDTAARKNIWNINI